MQADEIQRFVQTAIGEILVDPPQLDDGAILLADLELESVQILELFELIEDHFDIIIDVQSAASVETIEQLVALVMKAQA